MRKPFLTATHERDDFDGIAFLNNHRTIFCLGNDFLIAFDRANRVGIPDD